MRRNSLQIDIWHKYVSITSLGSGKKNVIGEVTFVTKGLWK